MSFMSLSRIFRTMPPAGIIRTKATAMAITIPIRNDATANGSEIIKPALTIGKNALTIISARVSVINGSEARKLFNTDVFSEKLFAQFFQRAVGFQLVDCRAKFRHDFIIAFIDNQAGTDFFISRRRPNDFHARIRVFLQIV